jgi:phage/plasmid-associated DNA primase
VNFKPQTRYLVATNSLPTFEGESGAYGRRIHLALLTNVIPPSQQIDQFEDLIFKSEAPAIWNWILECVETVAKAGNISPYISTRELIEGEKALNANELDNFIEDHIVVELDWNTKSKTPNFLQKRNLKQAYLSVIKETKVSDKIIEDLLNKIIRMLIANDKYLDTIIDLKVKDPEALDKRLAYRSKLIEQLSTQKAGIKIVRDIRGLPGIKIVGTDLF